MGWACGGRICKSIIIIRYRYGNSTALIIGKTYCNPCPQRRSVQYEDGGLRIFIFISISFDYCGTWSLPVSYIPYDKDAKHILLISVSSIIYLMVVVVEEEEEEEEGSAVVYRIGNWEIRK